MTLWERSSFSNKGVWSHLRSPEVPNMSSQCWETQHRAYGGFASGMEARHPLGYPAVPTVTKGLYV